MYKILIIEDDVILNHHLKVQLNSDGHNVLSAKTAEEGIYFLKDHHCDIAVIDLGLPDMDGVELVTKVRTLKISIPILILTARSNWEEKVRALDAGADDYLVKPFQKEELIARMNALIRRHNRIAQSTIHAENMELNLLQKKLFILEEEIELTAFEYDILEFLVRHSCQVKSKFEILDLIYQDQSGDPNTIEVMVSRLRKKLTNAGISNPIETIRGQGYMFNLKTT